MKQKGVHLQLNETKASADRLFLLLVMQLLMKLLKQLHEKTSQRRLVQTEFGQAMKESEETSQEKQVVWSITLQNEAKSEFHRLRLICETGEANSKHFQRFLSVL